MPLWLLYLLIVLTVVRLTRLVTLDSLPLVAKPRDWVGAYLDPDQEQTERYRWARPRWGAVGHSISYLVECPWCASPYLAAGVIALTCQFTSVPLPWLVGAVASLAAGLIQSKIDDTD